MIRSLINRLVFAGTAFQRTFGLWYLAVKTRWKMLEDWTFFIQTSTIIHHMCLKPVGKFCTALYPVPCPLPPGSHCAVQNFVSGLNFVLYLWTSFPLVPWGMGCVSPRWCAVCLGRDLEELCNQPLNAKQSPAPNNSGDVSWGPWFWFSRILGPRL